MSWRIGLVRAARLSHIPPPRLAPNFFVRASHDESTSTQLEQFLRPLRYPDEPNTVRRHYLPFVAELERLKAEPSPPPLPPLLTREQLITILDLLATSGRPGDLACIRSMFSHLPEHFNVAITPDLHTIVIAALMRQGYVPIAQEWIGRISELPPHVAPTHDHFHTFLKGCPQHMFPVFMRDVVIQKMRQAGVRPNNETFSILIRCIVNNARHAKTVLKPETFSTILADMKMLRLAADPSLLSLISEYYIEHGFQSYADDMRKIYYSCFPDISTPEEEQMNAWRKQLGDASRNSGVGHSLDVFRGLAAVGCPASPETFRAILGSSRNIRDLHEVEQGLGLKAGASEYAVLVNNSVRTKHVDDGLKAYEAAKKSGVRPVAGLVAPLIRSLCAKDRKPLDVLNTHLDTALALYSDVDEAFPVAATDSPDTAANSHSEHANGPDLDIYTSLFRGLSHSSNIKTAYPIAKALFLDMKARSIKVTTAINISYIILEMRICETLEEAFKCYRKRRAALSENGYLAVLHAFSRMSLSMGHPDSLELYFQIVADMRLAGFRMSDSVYTDVLKQFAEIAGLRLNQWREGKEYTRDPLTPMPPDVYGDLGPAVQQVHNLMSLDPTVTPDRDVWNQLIDTYQRIGLFAEAYRVWEKLYLSGKYRPVGVSIIFDACGFAGQYEVAKKIADTLITDGYVFNAHNWNSYIECLCRLNRISEALRVLCQGMGSVGQPVKHDLSTLTILLKFAESRIQTNIILQRVRRFLPDLWEEFLKNKHSPP
ncbi:hypothetical protein B0H15DRAFT_942815 [Mycena belliarum]|uniref:Pentatricopeptide repeat-containing protein n=1 Tax=Mycena belliarum TaxID=1033014 RepID=A0AAD6UJG1_9AGAR|nr:hypothetical protein B0H15DRAFT_942815 [Mycena belliae]